jgi:ABC-type antimicrobial peptide transport system permease subunit
VRTFQRGPWFTIVGIVGNVHDAGLDRPADQMIYCPLVPPAQDPRWAPRDLAMLVRTDGDPSIAAAMLRDAIRRVDPTVPIYRVAPLPDIVSHAYARRSFTLVLIGCAAAAAILLAAVGLYGVIAFVVTLRTREIGIRLALGASPRAVRALVWKQGFGVAAAGAVVGLAGAGVMSRVLAAMLFEVRATDRLVFAASTLFLLSVAAAASWIPARRAAAIDPAEALRTE